jgi:hypothetical protein
MDDNEFEAMLQREYPTVQSPADCKCLEYDYECECMVVETPKYRNARNRRSRKRLRKSRIRQRKKVKSKKNNIIIGERYKHSYSAIKYLEKCILDNPNNSDKIQDRFEKMKVLMEDNYKLTFSGGFISKCIFKYLIEFIQCKDNVSICIQYLILFNGEIL